jgi:ubiquinone/menaquinone biosynthesis C-methylase UbiE
MDDTERGVLDTYEKAARFYDLWAAVFEGKVKRRCLALAAEARPKAILDVGVGTGDLFVDLATAHPDATLTGVDLSPAMLARAERKLRDRGLERCSLLREDARRLPFSQPSFDFVVSTYVLELLAPADYPVVAGDLVRACRPGGTIVVAGVIESDDYRVARWACRRNPAWQGGVDVGRWKAEVERAGAGVVLEEVIAERGFPACVVVARR